MDRRQKTKPLGVARYTTPPPGPFTPRPLIASTQAARKHDMSVPTMPTSKSRCARFHACMHAESRVTRNGCSLSTPHVPSLSPLFFFFFPSSTISSRCYVRAGRMIRAGVCEWVVDNGAGMLTQRGRGCGNAGCLMIFLHGIDRLHLLG
jgi:hypothetical protein